MFFNIITAVIVIALIIGAFQYGRYYGAAELFGEVLAIYHGDKARDELQAIRDDLESEWELTPNEKGTINMLLDITEEAILNHMEEEDT